MGADHLSALLEVDTAIETMGMLDHQAIRSDQKKALEDAEGADLEQISEELRLQQESVDEHEELLGEARVRAARLPCY